MHRKHGPEKAQKHRPEKHRLNAHLTSFLTPPPPGALLRRQGAWPPPGRLPGRATPGGGPRVSMSNECAWRWCFSGCVYVGLSVGLSVPQKAQKSCFLCTKTPFLCFLCGTELRRHENRGHI
jgi:hypothetical protein